MQLGAAGSNCTVAGVTRNGYALRYERCLDELRLLNAVGVWNHRREVIMALCRSSRDGASTAS